MAKNKKKSPPPKKAKAWAWLFFPLYGLDIKEDDGLHAPLWGDATLVSRAKIEDLVSCHAPQPSPLLVHGRLSEALGLERMAAVGNPVSLVEIPPESYVAVRARNDETASRLRADRVRAMLSATMFLRGLRATAFCGEPSEYAWFVAPLDISLTRGTPAKASIRPVVNPNIVQRPLRVSKAALRESIKSGRPVDPKTTGTWDLHAKHAVCKLLNDPKPSSFRERLIRTATLIQEASCSPSEFSKLQLAVTALERMANTSNFKLLERRLRSFVVEGARPDIDQILELRHKLTHEGRSVTAKDIANASKDALAFAWTILDVATAYSEHFTSEHFCEYLDALASARDADLTLARLLGTTSHTGQRDAFHASLRVKRPRMTLIAYENKGEPS